MRADRRLKAARVVVVLDMVSPLGVDVTTLFADNAINDGTATHEHCAGRHTRRLEGISSCRAPERPEVATSGASRRP